MKICFTCKENKFEGSFSPSKYHKDGFKGTCRSCINNKEKQKRMLGIGGDKERSAKYRLNNPEIRKETLSKYNSSMLRRACSQRYASTVNGFERRKYLNLERKSRERLQIIKGIELKKYMSQLKALAKNLEGQTGIKYCIDHIIPLKGHNVSGLNVPWNLQVVPYTYNAVKGNSV